MFSQRTLLAALLVATLLLATTLQFTRLGASVRCEHLRQPRRQFSTEIHYIAFWGAADDATAAMQRVKQRCATNSTMRVLQQITVAPRDVPRVFRNVESGGRSHYLRQHRRPPLPVLIVEVPHDYVRRKTFGRPGGQIVNRHMYDLKVLARGGDYRAYKIAHSSFDEKEMRDFAAPYFEHLGGFRSAAHLYDALNASSLRWFLDRVDGDRTGDDIDVVVDSVPACCFLARCLRATYKCYTDIAEKGGRTLLDLRDPTSAYYPSAWTGRILNETTGGADGGDPRRVPARAEDRYMLGLYHMYHHKNGRQSHERRQMLREMGERLGHRREDVLSLITFLAKRGYPITACTDEGVGRFIRNATEDSGTRKVYAYQKRYFVLYLSQQAYDREQSIHTRLQRFDVAPRVTGRNRQARVLEFEDGGRRIADLTPTDLDRVGDFGNQIKKIRSTLRTAGIVHNDVTAKNVLVDSNHRIRLIDFEWTNKRRPRNDRLYCRELPGAGRHDRLSAYVRSNDCLRWPSK